MTKENDLNAGPNWHKVTNESLDLLFLEAYITLLSSAVAAWNPIFESVSHYQHQSIFLNKNSIRKINKKKKKLKKETADGH